MNTREKISTALTESREWYTQDQLMSALQIFSSDTSEALKGLVADGVAQAVKPPPGFAKGARKIYAASGVEPPDGAGLPEKVRGFRAEAREQKRKGKGKHKPAARGALPVEKLPPGGAIEARFKRDVVAATPRWALCSDGAFINLATSREIDKHEARALVSFLRALDAHEVAA